MASPYQIVPIQNQATNNTRVSALRLFTNVDQTAEYPTSVSTTTLMANTSLVGAEIRIYDLNNIPTGSLGTELAGTESCGSATFAFQTNGGNQVWIQIMLAGYEEFGLDYTVGSSDTTLPVTLIADNNV
jgi:hypothetical protein